MSAKNKRIMNIEEGKEALKKAKKSGKTAIIDKLRPERNPDVDINKKRKKGRMMLL